MIEYPKRKPYFLARVVRLLTKSAAAMEIGPDGLSLVMIIAGQEDACRYTRPVNFWNRQLAVLCGISAENEKQFRRVRDRCVSAGWLHYESLGRRKHGRYFVVIPRHVNQDNDGACDEAPSDSVRQVSAVCPQSVRCVSAECPLNVRCVSAECPPSMPFPSPNPIPPPNASEGGEDPFKAGESETLEMQPLKATGRDLFQVLRGCLTCFGKDHGIACLDAALLVYDAPTITRCLREVFMARKAQIPADDILGVLEQATAPPPEKIDTPETLPPRIDIDHLLATGQIRLSPDRDAGVA